MSDHTIKNARQRSSPTGVKPRTGKPLAKKISETYLHNSGLYYLQRFASSRQNFITVMERKIRKSCFDHKDQDFQACMALLEILVDKFERSGLLNDDLYTTGMIQSLRRRGSSRAIILQKLQKKGIKRDIALVKLQHLDSDNIVEDPELEAALKFARKKKIGPFARENDAGKIQKFFAIFARGGFSYDTARKVLQTDMDAFE